MGLFVLIMLLLMVKAGTMQMSDYTCSTSCTGNSKFDYMTGNTYTYIYMSDITTQIVGASDDKASVHLTALVHLEVLGKCEVSMKLNKVDFSEYGQDDSKMKKISNDFKIGLEMNPTRFSYQDGRIEDICTYDDEPVWVLNVKRGIISLIQNNMDDFSTSVTVLETDVSGICNTMYSVLDSYEDYFSIQKSKDLVSCTDRHSFKSFIQGVPYTSKSYIKSLPLMKSDYNCKSEIESGLLKSVQCVEKNMFRPFSKSDSGAVTVNKQLLTFERTSSGTQDQGHIDLRTSLKFEHPHDIKREIRYDIFSKICEERVHGANAPKLFSELVYILKQADIITLSAINKELIDGRFCNNNSYRTRKYFLDALPFIGTRASIHMITDLITSNAINRHEADTWISSLSFIKRPTKEMVKEILPLVTEDIHSEKVLLSIGTLIHRYCVYHDDCADNDLIKTIISAITAKIATGCRVDNDNLKPTLRALKGLGNAGFADISTLTECMTLKSNPLDIRLSAIQATRREPCRSNRMALVALLQDESDNYETRIAAYKMLMACPSKNVIDAVKLTLAKESGNQISSYIWTHLSNLRTSDIYKQDIANILRDHELKRQFNLDNKRFARNYKLSGFIEMLNMGATIEADLIWSLESAFPHSGMLNVTFDVFGQSVNLFEIGGRVEGFESFILKYLRSDGYFANTDTGKRLRDIVEDEFSKQADEFRGSLYLRMFGNEILNMDIKEMETYLFGRESFPKLIKDGSFTFTQSLMFLDSKYMIPTSSGFTLSLTLLGTATIDSCKDSKGTKTASAMVYMAAMMSVDTSITNSGIKMVSTFMIGTHHNGNIIINGESITLKMRKDGDFIHLFYIESSIYIVGTVSEVKQNIIGTLLSDKICKGVTKLSGYCVETTFPSYNVTSEAPYFPLSGPFIVSVFIMYTLEKDTDIRFLSTSECAGVNQCAFTTNLLVDHISQFYIDAYWNIDTKIHRLDADIHFEDRNNPYVNTKIVGELLFSHSFQIRTNFDIWYGPDFQNDAKHIAIKLDMPMDYNRIISASIKYPEVFSLDADWNWANGIYESNRHTLVMNFEARNNPHVNTRIVGDFFKTPSNQMQTNLDIWYGPDFENDAKHIRLVMEYNYGKTSASIFTSIKYPALGVDVYLKGVYAGMRDSSIITSITIPALDVDVHFKLVFKRIHYNVSTYICYESRSGKYESYMPLRLHGHGQLTGYIAVISPTRVVILDIICVRSLKYPNNEKFQASFKFDIIKKYDSSKNIFKTYYGDDITSDISIPLKELSRLEFEATFFETIGKAIIDKFVFEFDQSNSYLFQPIIVTVELNKPIAKLSVEYSIGSEKKEIELTANTENVAFNIVYKCPTLGSYAVAYEHQGNLKDFKCHVKFVGNVEEWHGEFYLKTVGNIKGMLKLKPSSTSSLRPVIVALEHTWTSKTKRSRADIEVGGNKITYKLVCQGSQIIWNFEFNLGEINLNTDVVLHIKTSSVGLSFKITSSLCSDMTGDINIQGTLTDFSSTTIFEIANQEKKKHPPLKQMSKAIDSQTKFKSKMEKLSLHVKHHGDIARSNTGEIKSKHITETNSEYIYIDGTITMNKANSFNMEPLHYDSVSIKTQKASDRYTISFNFSLKENFYFDVIIISPKEGYKSLSANFKQNVNARYLKCTSKVVNEREESILNFNLDIHFSMSTLTSSANLKIHADEYAVEVSTTNEDRLSFTNAKFILKTRVEPMPLSARSQNDVCVSFMQSGSSSGTVITYDVNINSFTKINGKISIIQLGSGQLLANVELRTPFKNMEVNQISYKYSIDSNNIQCDIKFSVDAKEVRGTISGSLQPLSMSVDIKTPLEILD